MSVLFVDFRGPGSGRPACAWSHHGTLIISNISLKTGCPQVFLSGDNRIPGHQNRFKPARYPLTGKFLFKHYPQNVLKYSNIHWCIVYDMYSIFTYIPYIYTCLYNILHFYGNILQIFRFYIGNFLESTGNPPCEVGWFPGDATYASQLCRTPRWYRHQLGGRVVILVPRHLTLEFSGMVISHPYVSLPLPLVHECI